MIHLNFVQNALAEMNLITAILKKQESARKVLSKVKCKGGGERAERVRKRE